MQIKTLIILQSSYPKVIPITYTNTLKLVSMFGNQLNSTQQGAGT